MSLRTDLIDVVDAGRALADDLGFRVRTVKTVKRTWESGTPGRGEYEEEVTTLAPTPRVAEPPARLVSETAGQFEEGDLLLSKVSASYDEDDLTGGEKSAGVQFFYVVDDRPYKLVRVPEKKSFEWKLWLRRNTAVRWAST